MITDEQIMDAIRAAEQADMEAWRAAEIEAPRTSNEVYRAVATKLDVSVEHVELVAIDDALCLGGG